MGPLIAGASAGRQAQREAERRGILYQPITGAVPRFREVVGDQVADSLAGQEFIRDLETGDKRVAAEFGLQRGPTLINNATERRKFLRELEARQVVLEAQQQKSQTAEQTPAPAQVNRGQSGAFLGTTTRASDVKTQQLLEGQSRTRGTFLGA